MKRTFPGKAIWDKVKDNPLLSFLTVLLIVLAVVFVAVMFSVCPKWIFNLLGIAGTEKPKFEALKFLGIGMGGLLIALQALMSYRRAKAMEDSVEKTEQGQQQDRLKNAIEHLVSRRRNMSPFFRRSIPAHGVAFTRRTPLVRLAQAPCEPGASAAQFCQPIYATGH